MLTQSACFLRLMQSLYHERGLTRDVGLEIAEKSHQDNPRVSIQLVEFQQAQVFYQSQSRVVEHHL